MSDPINFGLNNGRVGDSTGLKGPLDRTLNTEAVDAAIA